MKILKLLNKLSLSIFIVLLVLFSNNLHSEEEPVDIWDIKKIDSEIAKEEIGKNNVNIISSNIESENNTKANSLYDEIDRNPYFTGFAENEDRSKMNVTFNLANNDLLDDFLAKALDDGLYALKGHRNVGGVRASIYNAMPLAGCEALAEFMQEFERSNS